MNNKKQKKFDQLLEIFSLAGFKLVAMHEKRLSEMSELEKIGLISTMNIIINMLKQS